MSRDLILPSDRVAGCLPRKYKLGEVCPMFSERIKVIPQREWSDYIGQISLRPFVKHVLDQQYAGSCATESSTQSVMIGRAFRGKLDVLLNPWFIYYTTSHGQDRGDGRSGGSSIDENLEFIRENGIAPESIWPRSKGWMTKPSDEAYEAAKEFRIVEFYDITSIVEMVSALLLGFPVVYGASGHSVCKIEHLSDSQGLDINSWGTDKWGDGG
jgi:hypothetical protein